MPATKRAAQRTGKAGSQSLASMYKAEIGDLVSHPTIAPPRAFRGLVIATIVGVVPMIVHRWSHKAMAALGGIVKGDQQKKKRGPKIPTEDAAGALYMLDGYEAKRMEDLTAKSRYAISALQLKGALISAARTTPQSMTAMRQLVWVKQDAWPAEVPLIELHTSKPPEIFEHPAVNTSRTFDMRYRPMFRDWWFTARFEFEASQLSPNQAVHLLELACEGGFGDWRPNGKQSSGPYGVGRVEEVQVFMPKDYDEQMAIVAAAAEKSTGGKKAGGRKKS